MSWFTHVRNRRNPRRTLASACGAGALVASLLVVPAAEAAVAASHPAPSSHCTASQAAPVISWNETAAAVLGTDAAMPAPTMGVGMAYVQAAVYNAVVGIDGEHQLYRWNVRGPSGASVPAAAAAAARVVLDHYFPVGQARVAAAYASALAAIPAGRAKAAGIRYGEAAGLALLDRRSGDGWGAVGSFDRPPTPGIWRPTPPSNGSFLAPWLGTMRPFLLRSADQFRPGSPPALSSSRYAEDFAEVAAVGSATSTTRTAQQTEIARFFGGNLTVQLQAAYRDHLTRHCMTAADAAYYLLLTNLTAADALISSWDTKLTFATWRPITAIREGDTDGNPLTVGDPAWTPLIGTPPFPEYASAHSEVIGAVTRALQLTYRTDRIDLNISSSITQTTRHYDTIDTLRAEALGARIWGGIHWRTSTEVGSSVGIVVGTWTSAALYDRTQRFPGHCSRAVAW